MFRIFCIFSGLVNLFEALYKKQNMGRKVENSKDFHKKYADFWNYAKVFVTVIMWSSPLCEVNVASV
jgi:hypothetical protein